ncbi:hypothetical protein [Costertonia aggregata]|uniref:Uncharacterized protein n=1 Tax=Costertonia aggregata TaxID=343403 RepID=A0A7H9ATP9_9FLAO|nr:hypothetical protein [Costertonia aggregata]QLG46861.1 hypothetical protein HYG79_16375 [Costertonia aggregata]
MKLRQNWSVLYNENIKSMEFDVDYMLSSPKDLREQYSEERRVKIDNTLVAPRVTIEKLKF